MKKIGTIAKTPIYSMSLISLSARMKAIAVPAKKCTILHNVNTPSSIL
jgi:hypothetical protein